MGMVLVPPAAGFSPMIQRLMLIITQESIPPVIMLLVSVRVFTEYLITLGHLLRTNRLRAYNL